MRRVAAAPKQNSGRLALSEEALVMREQRGHIALLTMVYRPYNLLGPKLINAIVDQIEQAQKAGSRAIVLRSGLRHFSAGADLDIFDKRVAEAAAIRVAKIAGSTGSNFCALWNCCRFR
jgi:enoyl-CoA hydratase/carnithine racemase